MKRVAKYLLLISLMLSFSNIMSQPRTSINERIKDLDEAINLTEEQEAAIKAIYEDTFEEMRKMRENFEACDVTYS